MSDFDRDEHSDILTKDKVETQEPPMYSVILLNDDYTTMDFVIMVLQSVFKKSSKESEGIMMAVHEKGRGVAGTYIREVAETRIAIVHQLARQNEYPLRCTMEPA